MYYSNEFINELENSTKLKIDKSMYANIQAHNVSRMLKADRSFYKLFGVYWWAVKDALRRHVNNGEWYCGIQDDPLMKERAWHGSEFRTMLAAMYYSNEHRSATSAHEWYDKNGDAHSYTLDDPDVGLK